MATQVEFNDHKCFICSRECNGRRSLGNHLVRVHHVTIEEYVLKYYYYGVVPKCKCGCGNDVKWHKTLYKYNDFLNGHNEAGFKDPKFSLTREQIDARNESIRNAYRKCERTKTSRISSMVKNDSLEDKVVVNDLCPVPLAESPICSKLSGSSDFRNKKKILIGLIKDLINNEDEIDKNGVMYNHWIEHEGLCKIYDIFIPEHNLLIDIDDSKALGLDAKAGLSCEQLKLITHSLKKIEFAQSAKHDLIKFRDDTDVSNVLSFDDLMQRAYHIQGFSGYVLVDGSFKFEHDRQQLIRRDDLIRLNSTEEGRIWNENVLLPTLVDFFKTYVECKGFFYPLSRESLRESVDTVRKKSLMTSIVDCSLKVTGQHGMSYLKSNFKSFWHVSDGPVEQSSNKKSLERVIAYRLGLNNSKDYTYVMDTGETVTCRETFDVCPRTIRQGFVVQRRAVSFFRPMTASVLYRHFLGDVEHPVVWDPSCGFGARLLGFVSMYPDGTYYGNEPASMTMSDLETMKSELRVLLPNAKIELNRNGSEIDDGFLPNEGVDLVFTSPPFFSKERYFDEPGQCWKDYPKLELWTDNYVIPTLQKAYDCLKTGGTLAINIDNGNSGIFIDSAIKVGFKHETEISLIFSRDHFNRAVGSSSGRSEPVLIFRK